ncbi:MAG: response regulator, partial [Anaerolineae bacterium]|nr:response regulator [Anaerolineae bacterium]
MMLVVGVATGVIGQVQQKTADWTTMLDFTLLVFGLTLAAWFLNSWRPRLGEWGTIIGLITIIYWGDQWLGVPGFLTLLVIPTALAAALLSLSAAAVIALGQTGLLVIPGIVGIGSAPATIIPPLLAIWAILGVMAAVYQPIYQVAQWAWNYFQQAQTLLEEAQSRKMELEQALEDLAQANLQLTRLNVMAQGLRQVAENARRAKEEFVANVSHELRTPLNMIVGFSETILQSPQTYGDRIPPALLADLMVVYRNAEHLSGLIDDVLDLSQIDAEQMALTKEEVQFLEIVEEAATAIRPLYDSKGLYLELKIPANLPPVFCDRTRMREVLLNLLSNAGRFTDRGGVGLRIWLDTNDIMVSVTDSGPGITAEEMAKLFQPFQQLDSSIRRRYGGTGLGLSISERFIKLHGGKIWVESKKGVGTTFYFRIPAKPPVLAEDGFLRGLTPDWDFLQRTRPSAAPKTVVRPRFVILEAGNVLQRLLNRYWNEVEIVPAASLAEAIEEITRVPTQGLLVNEPSVSKTLDAITSARLFPNDTPVIICSILTPDEECTSRGASARLVKPISQERMLQVLDQLDIKAGTILIVDDEPDALQLFRRMLVSAGRDYKILLARDGQEALNIIRERRPDVILLDLIMPTIDGFQFLELRSQQPDLLEIPVVIISARDPAGQPIVSKALAVTGGRGLSVRQLLASMEALLKVLATSGPVGDLMPTVT